MDREHDLGLFGPDSVSWRVHSEPVLWLAGLRALYLQALHPRAIAGVIQHSDFREDAWGRLMRTADYVGTVVFGTTADARAAGARIRRIHERLRGTDPGTGEEFRIDEPHLLRWVHVTEVESFVTTARRAGAPLSTSDVDAYYAEQLRSAELVGLDPRTVPASTAEVDEYYRDIRAELSAGELTAEVVRFLTIPPMPRLVGLAGGRLGWLAVSAAGFALLPRWARRLYRLPGLPTTDLSATLTVRALRAAISVVPGALEGPIYKDAMRRAELAAQAIG
ncbi:MAG TPA: oxygenase MpaB family protein [Jiangellaceae bacterium]|nr:oxygenase MpaB family protein [Jiangellaceae bacterium]